MYRGVLRQLQSLFYRGQFPTLKFLCFFLSLIIAVYANRIMMDKISTWKRSQNQVSPSEKEPSEQKTNVPMINNVSLNPKIINLKLLSFVVLFS